MMCLHNRCCGSIVFSRDAAADDAVGQDASARHHEQAVETDQAVDAHRGHRLRPATRLLASDEHRLEQVPPDTAQ